MNYRYELNYVIAADLILEEARALGQKIENIIQEEGGSLIETRNPIHKDLSKPIKTSLQPKKTSGFFGIVAF